MNNNFSAIFNCLIYKTVTVKHHSLFAKENRVRFFLSRVRHQTFYFNIRYVIK